MHVDVIIVGQGLAGSVLAWTLHWQGHTVMLLDRQEQHTASTTAAGLITPVTGQRMLQADDFEGLYQTAREFYRRVERETASAFFSEEPMVRFFRDEVEKQVFQQRQVTGRNSAIALVRSPTGEITGFEMQQAARLRVDRFLKVTRDRFTAMNQYYRADIDIDAEVLVEPEGIRIPKHDLSGDRLVFCQGYQPSPTQWFPNVPNRPVGGDILRVRIAGWTETRIVHRGIWLVPEGDGTCLVGATYDWDNLSNTPSAQGREELLTRLAELVNLPTEVLEHRAAVRPAMMNQQPVVARHATQPRLAILNGLGAKGSLRAPEAARRLSERLWQEPVGAPVRRSLTRQVHELLKAVIGPGDTVIDATAGNGHDTLYLARRTGPAGRVIAFDIQSAAIRNTRQRLQKAEIENVQFEQQSHVAMGRVAAAGTVAAIVFNLGYLPGSDKSITTQASATREAIREGSVLLRPGGMMTILAYRGHLGGLAEADAVAEQLGQLSTENYSVGREEADPEDRTSPVLFVVQRRSKPANQGSAGTEPAGAER